MKRGIQTPLPSIESLVVFGDAAASLSFTKTGAKLGVSQSAISRHIIDLEALLQVALFSREKKRLALTKAGAEFLELVTPVLKELSLATTRMEAHSMQGLAVERDRAL